MPLSHEMAHLSHANREGSDETVHPWSSLFAHIIYGP